MLSSPLSYLTWQEEVRTAFKSAKDLSLFFGIKISEIENYPLFIPRSFALRIKSAGLNSPLAKQFLPSFEEIDHSFQNGGLFDPIGDEVNSKGGQIIHRYKNRLLFTPTTKCPVNCRYCFRKNELFEQDEIFKADFDKTLSYLLTHPEVDEIIFTGGDPLFLSNKKIEHYLNAFSEIPHLKYIRFHTRFPVIIPARLDEELKSIIKKFEKRFNKIIFVLHANHADELSNEVIKKIKQSGFYWLSQSVLLKGVNDQKEILKNLLYRLDEAGIRPYYLHHPDHVKGAMHFYLSLEKGRELYHALRDELSGWIIPQYIIDVPGGLGKVPASNPETLTYSGTLLDRKGQKHHISL